MTSSTPNSSFDDGGFDMDMFLVHLAARLLGPSTVQQAALNGQPFDISWRSPVLRRSMSIHGEEAAHATTMAAAPWNGMGTTATKSKYDRESYWSIHCLVLVDLRFDFLADGSISFRTQTLWQQQCCSNTMTLTKNDNNNHSMEYQYYIGKPINKDVLERHFESLQIDVYHTPAPLLAKSMAEAWQRISTVVVTLPQNSSSLSLYLPLEYNIRESILVAPMTVWEGNDDTDGYGTKLNIPHDFVHITCQHLDRVQPKDTKTQTQSLDIELLDVFHHITKTWRTAVRTATKNDAENSKLVIPDKVEDAEWTLAASSVPDTSSCLPDKKWKEVRVSRRGKGAGFGRKRKL